MAYKTRYYCDSCENNWTTHIDKVVVECPTCGYDNIEEIPTDGEDTPEEERYHHETGYIPPWVDDYLD